jgi:hypothetical protein
VSGTWSSPAVLCAGRGRASESLGIARFRYALYQSYVLLAKPPIEPISHPIRALVPLGKAQRIEEVTYDPLLYLEVGLAATHGRP